MRLIRFLGTWVTPDVFRSLPGRKRTVSKQAFFLAARCLLVKVPGYGM